MEADVEDSYGHQDPLPDGIIYAVKPTYVRLASKELLQRCLCGATQHANEQYKGLLSSFCPTREEFCGRGTVEIAANLAVLQFNNGAKAMAKLLEEIGCSTRFYMEAACVWKGKQKKDGAMKVRRRGKKAWEEQVVDQEGTAYEAGPVWVFFSIIIR